MSNYHLRNKELSLKAKGLLTLMLSLPDDWDYSVLGLASLSKDGKDAVMTTLDELKTNGYLTMTQTRDDKGHLSGWTYDVYETPNTENTESEKPYAENPNTGNPLQLNTNKQNTKIIEDNNYSRINTSNNNISSKKEKKSKKEFDLSFIEPDFSDIFTQWLEYKHERKESYKTQRSLELCYEKLIKLSNHNPFIAQQIIEQSMANNYMGLFPLKNEQRNNQQGQTDAQGFNTNPYIQAGYDPRELL